MPHKWVNFSQLAVLVPFPQYNLVETVAMGGDELVADGGEAHVADLGAGVDLCQFLECV